MAGRDGGAGHPLLRAGSAQPGGRSRQVRHRRAVAGRLADGALKPGNKLQLTIFDPATLKNAPLMVEVGRREAIRSSGVTVPAFRVEMEYAGLHTTSWITDTGEVLREESPLGLISV